MTFEPDTESYKKIKFYRYSGLYLSQDVSYPQLRLVNFLKESKLKGFPRLFTVDPGPEFLSTFTFKYPMKSVVYMEDKIWIGGSIGVTE
jgi:hypothetical protein